MAGTVVVGRLFRKRTVRNLDGSIREMLDEANGGTIIRGGHVVNVDRVNELARIERDKQAATAASSAVVEVPPEVVAARSQVPSELNIVTSPAPEVGGEMPQVTPYRASPIEDRVTALETGIGQILELLQKPKRKKKNETLD